MSDNSFINVLIAEDNDVSRELMAGILRTQGYNIFGAIDGESAIKVVEDRPIDLALVDINMAPKGGFEFVKYLVVKSIKIPVIIVSASDSSDILTQASALGVQRVIQKPIDPEKLIQSVQRLLRQKGVNPKPLAVTATDTHLSPEALMNRAVELADRNAKSKRGGPFGAVVADAKGKILGEGVNGITSRADPTAHAEVMAIRQAAEKLGRTDLSDCVLYCSSQPTAIGEALIASVGIGTVYYGLSHSEISSVRDAKKGGGAVRTAYVQLGHDAAMAMFQSWQSQTDKVAD
ncbi:MAG: response regulator [Alphaproteobacteria bacterium]